MGQVYYRRRACFYSTSTNQFEQYFFGTAGQQCGTPLAEIRSIGADNSLTQRGCCSLGAIGNLKLGGDVV